MSNPLELMDTKCLDSINEGKIVYYINPHAIEYLPEHDFSIAARDEKVSDGDWDLSIVNFNTNSIAYEGFYDVFYNDKDWQDTKLYNGEYQAGVTRVGDIPEEDKKLWKDLRCNYLTYIFKSMREFGYYQDPYADHVSVIIGRHGEIILNNGRHRLSMAKLLNVSMIPIVIDVRHKDWVELKKDIVDYSKNHNNMVYAPLIHFDLNEVPFRQQNRAKDVLDSIGKDVKTVVDLGSNWGYMCKVLSSKGYDCLAVEGDIIEYSFLERLQCGFNFKMVNADICDFIKLRPKFDCVLALSILHHLAKTEEGHNRLIQMLNMLDCKQMIFQMPLSSEMKLFNCYRDYDSSEWMRLIIRNSCLNVSEEIGNRNDRKMYVLRK